MHQLGERESWAYPDGGGGGGTCPSQREFGCRGSKRRGGELQGARHTLPAQQRVHDRVGWSRKEKE